MGDPLRTLKLNFQSKVLIPVVTVLVVFVAATLWLFSSRIEQQLRRDAALQRCWSCFITPLYTSKATSRVPPCYGSCRDSAMRESISSSY